MIPRLPPGAAVEAVAEAAVAVHAQRVLAGVKAESAQGLVAADGVRAAAEYDRPITVVSVDAHEMATTLVGDIDRVTNGIENDTDGILERWRGRVSQRSGPS